MASGSIRKRETKNGYAYRLTVECGTDPLTGKRIRKYYTVKGTKKQAEHVLRKMILDYENGNLIEESAMRLGDWMNEWVENYVIDVEATTMERYKTAIRTCINPYLGDIRLKSLKARNIQQWINYLWKEKNLAPKSIRNVFLNLRSALNKAEALDMIARNPCKHVELPRQKKYKGNIYTAQEMKQMLELAKDTEIYLMLLLACYCGFRRGELAALSWDDVDFTTNTITIRQNTVYSEGKKITKEPKTAAGCRELTVGDSVMEELRKARADYIKRRLLKGCSFHHTNLVLCKENGEAYRPDGITYRWRKFMKENGLKEIRFHDLRHSCATAMIEAGIDPKTVQQRLGHADISVTLNIYAHATKAMDEKAAVKLENLMFG